MGARRLLRDGYPSESVKRTGLSRLSGATKLLLSVPIGLLVLELTGRAVARLGGRSYDARYLEASLRAVFDEGEVCLYGEEQRSARRLRRTASERSCSAESACRLSNAALMVSSCSRRLSI